MYFCLSAHGGQGLELFRNGSKANVVTDLQQHSTGESSDRSKANVITGLQQHSAGGFPANPGPVIQNPHNTGLQHHSAGGFPANPGPVIQNLHNTGLQHHSAGGLPANPGPVIQNPHNKGESLKPLSFLLLYKLTNNIYFCILCRTFYIY